ncbi:Uncharacterized protein PBTT_05288 [Plasmodiophora brassicae]
MVVASAASLNPKQALVKRRCDARSAQVGENIVKQLGDDTLEFDTHTTSGFVLETLCKALQAVPSFTTVRIGSSARAKGTAGGKPRRDVAYSSTRLADKEFIKLLVRGLARNTQLVTVELDALPPALVKRLPAALGASTGSLRSVTLRDMPIDDATFARLVQSLSQGQINRWEFEGCNLTDACMRPVRDLLHSHNTRRDVAKWQDKLRSDQPSAPVAQLGVLALNLQRNAITDRGVHELAEALADDKWLLEIDLSANPIGAGAVGDLVDVLDTNAALSVVRIDDIACRDALLIDRLARRLVERADRKHGTPSPTAILPASPSKPVWRARKAKSQWPSTRPTSPSAFKTVNVRVPDSPTSAGTARLPLKDALEALVAKLTAPDPGPVDDLIAAIVDEVHTQTQAQDRLRKRIRQLEQENAALKTAATAHQQQAPARPSSVPPAKGTRRKQARPRSAAAKPATAAASSVTRKPGGSSTRPKPASSDANKDVRQITQLVGFLEGLFVRLHQIMDDLEKGNDDGAAVAGEIRRAAADYKVVASKVQSVNAKQ